MAHSFHTPSVLLLLITLTIFAPHNVSAIHPGPRASAIFIFGDSSADVGTNNHIEGCAFNANNTPYGRDHSGGVPTGRWSNGFNTIDYLSKAMLKYSEGSPKPYMTLEKEENPDYESGVNFASAGSGNSDYSSGPSYMNPMRVQTKQFEIVREKLATEMGEDVFNTYISKAIFLISVGSNDIIQFGLRFPTYTEETKQKGLKLYPSLVMHFTLFEIEKLYELGARKFAVISVLAMGCCPGLRKQEGDRECTSYFNEMSKSYMIEAKSYLKEMQRLYKDLKYSFGDTYSMMMNVMDGKSNNTLKVFDKPCCEDGCGKENAKACENPEEYAFWDDYHPTDAASKYMADALYNGTEATLGLKLVTPITFKQLVEEDYANDPLEVQAFFAESIFPSF